MTGREKGKSDAVLRKSLLAGPFPSDDGWRLFYQMFRHFVLPVECLGTLACAYLWPKPFERTRRGRLFRILGVHMFGRIIPTGGMAIRRLTRSRMAPYTLKEISVRGARAFFYRTCVFEMLHLPFFLAMTALTAHRFLIGRSDLAVENMLINLLLNIYPMLHHRHTRVRILLILTTKGTGYSVPPRGTV